MSIEWIVLLVALAWAAPSFLLHNLIHEGAHAVVALLFGASSVRIWPFPGKRTGSFTWAHVTYVGPVEGAGLWLLFPAPLIAEILWFSLFVVLYSVLPMGWWFGLIACELVAPLVDMTTWFAGYWNPIIPYSCDAERFRIKKPFRRLTGKIASLVVLLPMYALVVVLLVSLFFHK